MYAEFGREVTSTRVRLYDHTLRIANTFVLSVQRSDAHDFFSVREIACSMCIPAVPRFHAKRITGVILACMF